MEYVHWNNRKGGGVSRPGGMSEKNYRRDKNHQNFRIFCAIIPEKICSKKVPTFWISKTKMSSYMKKRSYRRSTVILCLLLHFQCREFTTEIIRIILRPGISRESPLSPLPRSGHDNACVRKDWKKNAKNLSNISKCKKNQTFFDRKTILRWN